MRNSIAIVVILGLATACPRPEPVHRSWPELRALPAIHPAHPGASCRGLSETVERVHMGEPVDECDLRNIVEAEEEIEYLRGLRDREMNCWDDLESCEQGSVSASACFDYEITRFDAVIEDLDACARAAEDR